jgi:hypothetical protein
MVASKSQKHESVGPKSKKILLVQPDYPIPNKRKVHHDFFPMGLLKIGTYLKWQRDCDVELIMGNNTSRFKPDEIWITSLFTYWSSYVHDSIDHYQKLYPGVPIYLGGIYATLMAEDINISGVTVQKGVYTPAEEYSKHNFVDETLLNDSLDFQIMHTMRGCFRKCKFCGTWRLEPKEIFTDGIVDLINKNHVIFYDNNILRRPDIEDFLERLANVRVGNKPVKYESQSGFDGRILNQNIANLLRKARFINVRIAWDGKYSDHLDIDNQIDYLLKAGYKSKDITVFMLYNWDITPEEIEKKRIHCWERRVQISDCRFRPLNQLEDHYNTRLKQDSKDYYIHDLWSDETVKRFRRNIRRHNICVRHDFNFHSSVLERKGLSKETISMYKKLENKEKLSKDLPDVWFPDEDNMGDLINF